MIELSRGFPPVAAPDARILILGSMPGQASLAAGHYYAHPRNAFWPVMATLLGWPEGLAYDARCAALTRAGIALWDVLHACRRQGSLDASIERESAIANDIAGFIGAHPAIRHIFFNGTAAEKAFRRLEIPGFARRGIATARLPSTSPAHAGITSAARLAAWEAVATALASRSTRPA